MARPYIEMDLDQVQRAASIGCSYEEIAVIVGMSRTTFYERLAEDPSIRDLIEQGKDRGKSTLRRLQWQRAQGGSDTMLIWLGKQVLGQKDRNELTGANDGAVVLQVLTGVPRPDADEQPC